MTTKQNKGFTLLEILLVIAAIGILAAIVLVAINPNRQIAQARNTVRQADINTIQKAVEQYLIDNGSYPSSISTTPGYICNTGTEQVGGSTNCSGRIDLRELVPTYIAGIPKDPQATGTSTGYIVAINPDNNKVSIQASLSERGILVINPLSIVTNGLVLNLDAGNPASYPGAGTTWFDLSGNGRNGTLVNGVGFNSANRGALSFDGVNDYVSIASNPTFNMSTGDYTIDGWYYLNTLSNRQTALSLGTPMNSLYWVLIPGGANGSIYFGTGSGFWGWTGTLTTNSNLVTANSWNNVTVVRNGTTLNIYVNTILVSSTPSFNFGSGQGGTLYIGTYFLNTNNDGSWFNGRISSLKFYQGKGLTPEEIQQNFNATRGRFGL